MIGFVISLPVHAKHLADENLQDLYQSSAELQTYAQSTNYLDKTLAWTDQKINDLKQSIRKHPWRYAAGITAAAALIGLAIYKFKIKSAILPKSTSAIPSTTLSIIPQSTEPIEAIARAIPAGVPAVGLPQQTPKQFLVELQKAVEADLFRVECLMSERKPITGLESFKQVTSTNHVAELHAGLKKVKDAFLFVAGFEVNPPQTMNEMHRLHNNLKLMQQSIQEALPRYN